MDMPGNDGKECFCGKVDDLNPTDGASNQAHLSFNFHFRVLINVIKCCRFKEDLDKP